MAKSSEKQSTTEWSLNPLLSFKLLYWMFFKPPQWWAYLAEYNHLGLQPDFKLIDIKWSHLQRQGPHYLVLQSYLFLLLLGCLIGFALNFLVSENFLFSFIGAVGFALVLGIALGIKLSAAIGAVSTGLFAIAGFFLFSETQDFELRSTLALCFIVGMVGNLVVSNFSTNHELSWSNQVGSIVLGLLLSIVFSICLVTLALFLQAIFDSFYNSAELATQSTRLALITMAAIGLLVIFFKSITQPIVITYILTIIGLSILATFSTNELEKLSIGILNAVTVSIFLILPMAIIDWLIPKRKPFQKYVVATLGISIGVFIVALVWSAISALITDYLNPEAESHWYYIQLGLTAAIISLFLLRFLIVVPISLIWNVLIYLIASHRLANQQSFNIKWHSIFWDDFYYQIDKAGLKDYFKLFVNEKSAELREAIQELDLRLAPKTNVAEEMRYLIDMLKMQEVKSLEQITQLRQELAVLTPESPWLQHFYNASIQVTEALNSPYVYDKIEGLNKPLSDLSNVLEILKSQPTASETSLISVYKQWYKLISTYKAALEQLVKEEGLLKSPYVVGQPVVKSLSSATFVGRTCTIEKIKDHLRQGKSLFIHGYPRIGKTSLLKNLPTCLPKHFVCVQLDLQIIVSVAKTTNELLWQVARRIYKTLQTEKMALPNAPQYSTDYTINEFETWLATVKATIRPNTLLLIFDEFSKLKQAIQHNKTDYDEKILAVFANWLHPYSNMRIILVGHDSQQIDGLSVLAHELVIENLSYLREESARELIQYPTLDFLLRYTEEAAQKIIAVTRCQPAYIQLLCRHLVIDVKNIQPMNSRLLARLEDIEQAIPYAIEHGGNILGAIQILLNEAERTLAKQIAQQGADVGVAKNELLAQYPDNFEAMMTKLVNLGVLEYTAGDANTESGYRFQVELVRAWYALEIE